MKTDISFKNHTISRFAGYWLVKPNNEWDWFQIPFNTAEQAKSWIRLRIDPIRKASFRTRILNSSPLTSTQIDRYLSGMAGSHTVKMFDLTSQL